MKLSRAGRNKVKKTVKRTIKKRREKTQETALYLIRLAKSAPSRKCIVCGEFNEYCLDNHHPNPARYPRLTVVLCGSCHRVFDKGGGLQQLQERRERYFGYNLSLESDKTSASRRKHGN